MTAPDVAVETPIAPVVPAAAPVAAPITEPDMAQPGAVPDTPGELLSRRDAKRGLHQDRTAAEAPAAPEVPAQTGPVGTPPAAAPVTPDHITIPIPEGHPLREMGATEFVVQTPQQERTIRAALNGYERRSVVDGLKAQLRERELREAQDEARRTATQRWTGRPEYKEAVQTYNEMKDAFGQEKADIYWRGVNAGFEKEAQGEYAKRVDAITERDQVENVQRWKADAWANANALPASIRNLPSFSKLFEDAVMSFNAEVELGHYPSVVDNDSAHKAFTGFFGTRLTMTPEVVALYKAATQQGDQQRTAAAARAAEAQRQKEQIEKAAIERYEREGATRRTQVPPHPLGNLGNASRNRVPSGAGSPAAGEPAAEMTANEVRRQAKAASREDTRRRFAGT